MTAMKTQVPHSTGQIISNRGNNPHPDYIKPAMFFTPLNNFTEQLKQLLGVDIADPKAVVAAIKALETCQQLFKNFIAGKGGANLASGAIDEANRTIKLLSAKLICLKDCAGRNAKQAEIHFGLCRADVGFMFVIMGKWYGRYSERA